MNKYQIILDLFRKTIASLSSIEKVTFDTNIKGEADEYIRDLVIQYGIFLESKSANKIKFKFSEEDIVDFSYRCIENRENDFVRFAEDAQFGIIELTKELANYTIN